MTFDWRYGIGTVAALWLVGTICTGLFMFFFNPRPDNHNVRTEWSERLKATFGLSFFLWPFLLPAALNSFLFHRSIRTSKRPSWLVYADDENQGGQWTLSDGTEFLASAHGGTSQKPSHFLADYMNDEMHGEIQFRVRMIAPSTKSFSEWKPLSFTAVPAVAEDDKEPDDCIADRYEAEMKLLRGKFAVEFRAQNRSGVFEERSGVTMIVADDVDYE